MSGEQFHILLVEDSEADIYLLRKALENTGLNIQLTVIEDGAEALAFARSEGKYKEAVVPDLALLDLNLPKKQGVEVLAGLRGNERFKAVPVLIMTSSASPIERRSMESLGVVRYLTKPADLNAFLQIGTIVSEVLLRGEPKGTAQ
jgi:two-component system, chemotaxis family, response regulator Rcp1